MKFSTRLYAAFAGCITFTLILGVFALIQIGRLADHAHEIGATWMPSVQELISVKSEMREFRTQELQHLISTEAAEMADWEAKMAKTLERIDAHMAAYGKLIVLPEEREAFELLKKQQQARVEGHMRVRALSRENRTAEATALVRGEVAQLRAATGATVDKLVDLNVKGAGQQVSASEASASTARVLIPSLIVVALLLSGGVAWFIVRSTMRQLGGDPAVTREAVDRIAGGDLVTPVPVAAGDTTSLLASMAKMRESLSGIVTTIVAGSDEIKVASQEVARGNIDLSARTEQQSSSLQETASAMEELTGTVRQTADNARSANQLAQAASQTAMRGGQTVGQVVVTMQTISESSRKVQEIITVIDGIAFQTNILALNAAVEAARAGEQGRGFAVVAGEVRTLAQRSAEAAREIKRLIEDSVSKVDDGSRLVTQAGDTMQEVVGSVRRVTDLIGEISAATDQQSSGIEQVNQAVGQLDTVTQQNAALVEEAAAATQSMEEQAARLARAICAFRVDSHAGAAVVAPTRLPKIG